MTPSLFPKDFIDLFVVLSKHDVKYLIVGAEAVIYHGFARLTGDIDIFYETSPENCRALFSALQEFWSGADIPIHYIGLEALIKNKEAAGRPKDLEDLKYLREAAKKPGSGS